MLMRKDVNNDVSKDSPIVLAKKQRAPLKLGNEGVHINNWGDNSKVA